MVVTDVSFYNEKRPLQLPRFLLCFSKVFTYNNLHDVDIKWLYAHTNNYSSAGHNSSNYTWNPQLGDLVHSVSFKTSKIPVAEFFDRIFVSIGESCWVSKFRSMKAKQAGQLDSLDLVINIAAYDDLIVDSKSPLTYLKIVPFPLQNVVNDAVPSMQSVAYASPGRLSTIGLSWTRIDSSHRSKHDFRKCVQTSISNEECIASRQRKQLKSRGLNIDRGYTVSSYFSDGVGSETDHSDCHFEACTSNLYRFTKSEGFIKFDKRLSTLGITTQSLINMKAALASARNLHSQFNPDVRKSFAFRATGIDYLTKEISNLLMQSTGYECSALKTLELVNSQSNVIQNIKAEKTKILTLRKNYITNSQQSFKSLIKVLFSWGYKHISFAYNIPVVYPFGIKNTVKDSDQLKDMSYGVMFYAKMMNQIISSLRFLRNQASAMANNYRNLKLTEFVRTFSSLKPLMAYTHYLAESIHWVETARRHMFEGGEQRKALFAHADEDIRTVLAQTNGHTRSWPKLYQENIWLRYSWSLLKNLKSSRTFDFMDSIEHFEVIYDQYAKQVNVPVFVDIFCYAYHSYVAIGERFYGTERSFTMTNADSKYKQLDDYTLFVLNQIAVQYSTVTLSTIELDGLEGAERRSCSRINGYPIYTTLNTSFNEARLKLKRDIWKMRGRGYFETQNFRHDATMSNTAAATLVIAKAMANYVMVFGEFISKSEKFNADYAQILDLISENLRLVSSLRTSLNEWHKMRIRNQNHVKPLVGRLSMLAQLVRDVLDGDGEEAVSIFLSRRGKILVGEIQYQVAEAMDRISSESEIFVRSQLITNNLHAILKRNGSVEHSVLRAILTAFLSETEVSQTALIESLTLCIHDRWQRAKKHSNQIIPKMTNWMTNVTKLVGRAKQYTKSTEISKNFIRENMMRVILFYDSMAVFNKTNKQFYDLSDMMSEVGSIGLLYVDIGMINILAAITVVLTSLISCFYEARDN